MPASRIDRATSHSGRRVTHVSVCSGAGGSTSLPSTALTGRLPQDSGGNKLPFGPTYRPRAASATNLKLGQAGGSLSALGNNVYVPPSSPPHQSAAPHPVPGARSVSDRHGLRINGMHGATDQSGAHAPPGHSRASALRHSWDGGALSLPELDNEVGLCGAQGGSPGMNTPDTIGGLEAVFSSRVSGEHSMDMVRYALASQACMLSAYYNMSEDAALHESQSMLPRVG